MMKRVLKKEGLDYSGLDRAIKSSLDKSGKIKELGDKFYSDKEKIDRKMDEIDLSNLSETDKKNLRNELEFATEKLKEQYDRDVTIEEERLKLEQLGLLDNMKQAEDEARTLADSMRNTHLDVASTGMDKAIDAAKEQQAAFEQMQLSANEKVEAVRQQMVYQRNKILSGKHKSF